jgi:hypothetical protein
LELPERKAPNSQAAAGSQEDLVRAHVEHILSSAGFVKSERLRRFLTYAVECALSGSVENLKEYSVALEVFDRSPDYNPKVDAVVRVEARRLRSRLEAYYANAGVNEPVRIHLPSGTYVPVIEIREPSKISDRVTRSGPVRPWKWLSAAAAVVLAIILILPRLTPRPDAPEIVRLVRDSSAALDPAVSHDGRKMAYASDQTGNLDIWVRDLDVSEARRLTTDPAADTSPDFSPDSSQIAFRSERDGGGVYLISTAGGRERLLVPLGKSPRFSPDGTHIAYWTGQDHHFQGKVFIASITGSVSMRVGADLAMARWPIWSKDGRHLLVFGSRVAASVAGLAPASTDLFLVPVNGGPSQETGWTDAVRRTGIYPQGPVTWSGSLLLFTATTDWVNDFSGMTQGAANLWTIRLSQALRRVDGEPRRTTFGSASESAGGVLPNGDLVFSSTHYNVSVFETRLDESAKPIGPPHPVFSAPGSYVLPVLPKINPRAR